LTTSNTYCCAQATSTIASRAAVGQIDIRSLEGATVDALMASSALAFAWAALLIELTPGPNMTYLALLSAQRGVRTGLAAVAGVALGLLVIGLAAALGLGQLVERSPLLYETIRWGGALYLFWLAYEAWRGDDIEPTDRDANAQQRAFRDGLTTNLLNPKAAVFYISVLPAFTSSAHAYAPQAVVLTLIYVAVATGIHAAIVLAADRAADLLANAQARQNAGRFMAFALVVVALWVLYTTRRIG
jgi:threonine/homoserine/homoserine lactone efflux protein